MKPMYTKDIQRVSLGIMKDIHSFCVANNIRYSLYGGTLLGAIRHKGFIPWDDDIDVGMPRPDYERFISTYHSQLGYKVLAREQKDGADVFIAYARVCDFKETEIVQKTYWTTRKTGVWVDIFPLDAVESDYDICVSRLSQIRKVAMEGILYRHSISPISVLPDVKAKIKRVIEKVQAIKLKGNPYDKLIQMCKQLKWDESDYYANIVFTGYGIRERHRKAVWDELLLVPFEDARFYIIGGFDEALKEKFGDYMKLPPKEQQVAKHNAYYYYWK